MRTRDPRVERWLAALLATPGLTSIDDPDKAWHRHVEDALTALPLVREGPVADVGSGGGSPGLPLAAACPTLEFDLVEASQRKCAFLRATTTAFPNVRVVCARAEDHGRAAGRDAYAVAVARALAPPAVAAEWCLPLVRPGGIAVLFTGAIEAHELNAVAAALNAAPPQLHDVPASRSQALVVLHKLGPTPPTFPRRAGIARKRPIL